MIYFNNRHSDSFSPEVSLIISNYNGKQNLKNCLNSLINMKYNGNYQIIVIDAGSTDGSCKMVEEKFSNVKLIKINRIGIGQAVNLGIKSAKGDIIGFDLNNDEIFSENWLQVLVDALYNDEKIGVVGGIRLLYGTNNIIDEAGITFNYLGIPFSYIHNNILDLPKNPIEVDYTGIILFHRKILKKIGLVDEDYYLYAEDADFCARVKLCGYKIFAIPNAISYHKRSQTIGKSSILYTYYDYRSKIRFILINFSFVRMFISLFYYIPFLIMIKTVIFLPIFYKILYYSNGRLSFLLKECNKYNFRAFISAILWNVKNLKYTFQRRLFVKWTCKKNLI